MSIFTRKPRHPRIDPDELTAQADESMRRVAAQQPHVNALTSWLEARKDQNGFGEDFEYTLRPKEAR
ncbi:hypothetical protein [Herbiconiux sp.]|uniref:DUF7620 family protein n=1 Tax=Herbiconiux sp. TaxID=1871186 RepID=UPI0025C54A71|nr:hypothetical protein [Herbiconiux sp.]